LTIQNHPQAERLPERGMRMLHLEHPERPGEAWCGAPVVGVTGTGWKVDCVVCVDLRDAARCHGGAS
jgi:hypothetical protein